MTSGFAVNSAPSAQAGNSVRRSGNTIALVIALLATALTLFILYLSILKLNRGTFTYTMDDPYITLALSDRIRHGWYGIQAGEHTSPSSTMIAAFLLAPASGTFLHLQLPLLLNVLALFATLFILHRFASHLRLFPENRPGIAMNALALYGTAFCLNLIAVVFTGMEHSLHIAVTAACIYGLALFLDDGKMPKWLPWACIASPLLRYEGLALSFAVLLVLFLRGKRRTAVMSAAVIVLCVASFSLFLVSMKLPPMPSSVLQKSMVVANGVAGEKIGFFTSLLANAASMLIYKTGLGWRIPNPPGVLVYVALFTAFFLCIRQFPAHPGRWSSRGLMAMVLVCMAGGHALAGRMGWMFRYEDYLLLGTTLLTVYLFQEPIRGKLYGNRRFSWVAAAAVCLSLVCYHYIKNTILTPIAANNIYEQQYQMARFVQDYWRAPVAVNDLGLVSYGNPNYVLDLGGLTTEWSRKMLYGNHGPEPYRQMVQKCGVRLVIVYDEWFRGKIPGSWQKLASMDLSRIKISPALPEVQFYASDPAAIPVLTSELKAFQTSLPPGVKLKIY